MSKFEETKWADRQFSRSYRDDADIYIPFRYQCIEITKSFYKHFVSENAEARILDLGCGDGLFIQELLKSFAPAKVMLVDGSAAMLEAAKERLGNDETLYFAQASFQELLSNDPLNESYDFVYSSFAIHHLPFKEKKELYAYIHKRLSPGGCFVNYDVVCPPFDELESWYFSLWRQWIEVYPAEERREELLGTPEKYKGDPENMPDTLESQLETLKNVGFNNVDCYFKYGIFCLFGGTKSI
jgi:tRNA (cmo5U34)-methyltransferase